MNAAAEAFTLMGFAATLLWALREAALARLSQWTVYVCAALGAVGALLGGTLAPWLMAPGPVAWAGFDPIGGAKGMLGAVAGASLVGGIYLHLRQVAWLRYADAFVPACALGYVLARMACLLHADCFGSVTAVPWGLTWDAATPVGAAQIRLGLIAPDATETLPVHPTQVYHALLGLGIFLATTRLRHSAAGVRLVTGLALYAAGRFVIQFYRGETTPSFGGLDVTQVACVFMLAVAAGIGLHILRGMPRRVVARASV